MEQYRQKYREYLEKVLERIEPEDEAARQAAFERMRASNERMLAKDPSLEETGRAAMMREALEDVIRELSGPQAVPQTAGPEEIEETEEPPQISAAPPEAIADAEPLAAPPHPSIAAGPGGFLPGLAVGVVATAALLGLLMLGGAISLKAGSAAARVNLLEADYQASLQQFNDAIAFLSDAEEEIVRRQREEPDALTEAAGESLVRLRLIDPALDDRRREILPVRSNVLVQANATAYKIVIGGTLCRIAAMERPDLVDPSRVSDGLNCTLFGLWNDEGANF